MVFQRSVKRTKRALLGIARALTISNLPFDGFGTTRTDGGDLQNAAEPISLPPPSTESDVSIEEAIANRRSRREYAPEGLSRRELGQLLWAAQGVTDEPSGFRAAPSAGALHPLELYVAVAPTGVENLDGGVYRYRPGSHEVSRTSTRAVQSGLRAATLDQASVSEAAVAIVLCGVYERTTREYGERGRTRYVPMEAGHAGENLYLQAESLGLATLAVGAFDDDRVRDVVGIPARQRPLYIFPVGRPKDREDVLA